jgi:hypothetical protein
MKKNTYEYPKSSLLGI